MTDRDLEVYKFIVSYIKENGYAPTLREIGKGIGLVASMVIPHLQNLEKDGWIKTKPRQSRAIKVIGYEFVEV